MLICIYTMNKVFKWIEIECQCVSDCCLMSNEQFSAISWWEQVTFRWDDDDVRFVQNQQTWLDFYSANSLKQQSIDRNVPPLGHIILNQSQPVFAFTS